MIGRFAISTAGRDTGKQYVIVGKAEGMLLVADGVERRISNPKKKNPKHVAIFNREISPQLIEMISQQQKCCDEEIRRILQQRMKDGLRVK